MFEQWSKGQAIDAKLWAKIMGENIGDRTPLELPEGLKQELKSDLKRYEQEKQIPYITSIERMGIEEGLAQGRQRQQSMLLRQLTRKFSVLPEGTIAQLSELSIEQLDNLAEALLDFNSLDDLVHWLGDR